MTEITKISDITEICDYTEISDILDVTILFVLHKIIFMPVQSSYQFKSYTDYRFAWNNIYAKV